MKTDQYLKCPCKECGNSIEFPPSIRRTTIACPHCGQWTELDVPDSATEDNSRSKSLGCLVSIILLSLVLVGCVLGAIHWFRSRPARVVTTSGTNQIAALPMPVTKPANATATNRSTSSKVEPVKTVPSKPKEKSPDDLKTGEVTLEKTKGSSLVYAIGILKNDSEYQRFGVRVALDIFNSKGKKIASTQDYKDIIEPHQQWSFRALIPDSKATEAKISGIKED